MKVQPVSFAFKINNHNQTSPKKNVFSKQSGDSVSFSGYSNVLDNMVKTGLTRESIVENHFKKLMQSIWIDNTMIKTDIFSTITDLYTQKGLRGMLMEFWKATPSEKVKNIFANSKNSFRVSDFEKNDIVFKNDIGSISKEPVADIVNWGRYGFWNNILDNKKAPRDVRLSFREGLNNVELSLDKEGDLTVTQNRGKSEIITHFHALTGHRKVVIKDYDCGKPEINYYKKNGKEDFWKNFIFGGIPIDGIY